MHSFKIQNQSPWIVDLYNKYFPNKNNGFLVEIGVGHTLDGIDNIVDGTLDKIKNIYRCGSNTADLLDLGWSGIYIEPVLEYCEEAKISHLNNFDRLKIINIAAGDISDKIQMFLGDSFIPNDHGNRGYAWIGREVEIQPTSKILSDNGCPKNIDLMSIDVEGFEDKVIKGIDFNIHTPNMMVIEINIISLDEVSNLLPKEYEFIKSDNLNAVWVNTKK